MQITIDPPSSRNTSNVALAFFMNARNLHDAATDLCGAGFDANAINIAAPIKDRPLDAAMSRRVAAIGQHSLRWKMRRFLAHDRQRRGADQISGFDRDPHAFRNPECTHINLGAVLAAMNIPESVVWLLHGEATSSCVFMLVDAQDRVREASAILETNAGQLRTEYLREFAIQPSAEAFLSEQYCSDF